MRVQNSLSICTYLCLKNSLVLFQNIKLISILVQQGKLQEEELESVLKCLFPAKYVNIMTHSCYSLFIRMPLRDFICVERHVGRVLGSNLALIYSCHDSIPKRFLVQPLSGFSRCPREKTLGMSLCLIVFKWLISMLNNFQYPDHSFIAIA